MICSGKVKAGAPDASDSTVEPAAASKWCPDLDDGTMEVMTMKVNSTRFGKIEVDRQRLLNFPKGILGFPENHDFALLQTNDEGSFFWLQSVDRPDVAFVVCDPLLFVPDYQVAVKPEDYELLDLAHLNQAQVLVIVNKVDQMLTANLQGPLVINAVNRRGRQLVLSEKKHNTRHPLIDLETLREKVSKTA